MRKAAGIILIILGVLTAPGLFIILWGLANGFYSSYTLSYALPGMVVGIAHAPFLVTGGVFCLRKKYWRACLAAASFAVLAGIYALVAMLLTRYTFESWSEWGTALILVVLLADVIAAIFIVRTRKEWQGISDSVYGKVSYDG